MRFSLSVCEREINTLSKIVSCPSASSEKSVSNPGSLCLCYLEIKFVFYQVHTAVAEGGGGEGGYRKTKHLKKLEMANSGDFQNTTTAGNQATKTSAHCESYTNNFSIIEQKVLLDIDIIALLFEAFTLGAISSDKTKSF